MVQLTTRQVLVGARRLAPSGSHMKGSGRRQPGQKLRASLSASIAVGPNRIRATVGSRKEYATTVHDGSRPHVIYARGKMMKFRSDRLDFLVAARSGRRGGNKRRGGFHYALVVRHPGNRRPVRYLTTPLVQFGQANGFRVVLGSIPIRRLP